MTPGDLLEDMLGRSWRVPKKRERALAKLDDRALAELFLRAEDVLAALAHAPSKSQVEGEIWTYLAPDPGQEHRWLTSAVWADHVVLNRPDWVRGSPMALQSHRDLAAELAGGEPQQARASDPGPPPRLTPDPSPPNDALDQLLDQLHVETSHQIAYERETFRQQLPGWTDAYVRLLAAVADPIAAGRVSFVEALDPSWRIVVHQISQRYDDWGKNEFGLKLEELIGEEVGGSWGFRNPVRETVSFYEARQRLHPAHVGFVPSAPSVVKIAKLFLSHWGRLSFGFPMVADVAGDPPERSAFVEESRPALFDQIVVPALPRLAAVDPVTLWQAVEEPGVRAFRAHVQARIGEITSAETVGEAARLMAEARYDLAKRAEKARANLVKAQDEKAARHRGDVLWDLGTTGIGFAIGFFTSPLVGITAALAGRTIRTALKARGVEPDTPAKPDLSLFTL